MIEYLDKKPILWSNCHPRGSYLIHTMNWDKYLELKKFSMGFKGSTRNCYTEKWFNGYIYRCRMDQKMFDEFKKDKEFIPVQYW